MRIFAIREIFTNANGIARSDFMFRPLSKFDSSSNRSESIFFSASVLSIISLYKFYLFACSEKKHSKNQKSQVFIQSQKYSLTKVVDCINLLCTSPLVDSPSIRLPLLWYNSWRSNRFLSFSKVVFGQNLSNNKYLRKGIYHPPYINSKNKVYYCCLCIGQPTCKPPRWKIISNFGHKICFRAIS